MFRVLYPSLCEDTRLAPGSKSVTAWQMAVNCRLQRHYRLFLGEKLPGKYAKLYSLSPLVHQAIQAGCVDKVIKKAPVKPQRSARSVVKRQLNKVMAFGALAGR
mmetsp:Transcript_70303/g.228542  ORF Transcript_70303/g.228542 Transcript_70303/m.228542 type:complete len:104 (-) Transcript_70303:259-570(-)